MAYPAGNMDKCDEMRSRPISSQPALAASRQRIGQVWRSAREGAASAAANARPIALAGSRSKLLYQNVRDANCAWEGTACGSCTQCAARFGKSDALHQEKSRPLPIWGSKCSPRRQQPGCVLTSIRSGSVEVVERSPNRDKPLCCQSGLPESKQHDCTVIVQVTDQLRSRRKLEEPQVSISLRLHRKSCSNKSEG